MTPAFSAPLTRFGRGAACPGPAARPSRDTPCVQATCRLRQRRRLLLVDRRDRRLGCARRRGCVALALFALDDDLELLVRWQPRARGDQTAHDDVFLETSEVVHFAGDRKSTRLN